MDIEKKSKINQLLLSASPKGLLFSEWLKRNGYSDQLIKRYRESGWLEMLSDVYKRQPISQFRETSKDVASSAMSGSMNMNTSGYGNSLAQWGIQAMNNAYQKTSNAISKAIKKNKVKLKYGTFVYPQNGRS